MKSHTIASITRLGSLRFEILVDPDEALSFRTGKPVALSKVLVSDTIYTDAKKGMRAPKDDLIKAFGTTEVDQIAETILRKGKLRVTTEQRRRLIDEKRRRIVSLIARNCIDPRSNLPLTISKVEQALAESHFSIDPSVGAEEQFKKAVDAVSTIIPIKMTSIKADFTIPPQYAGKTYGMIRSSATIEKEEWRKDGSLRLRIEISAGLYADLLDRIGRVTRGSVEVRELGEER
ncbi:MAG: ribosome assembly factor SBDS [Candidatus Bathyarchaeia archaeon]